MQPSKPKPYNMVTATWKHGFQHSFVTVGHTLNGMLKDLEGLEYVKEVIHYEITKEEYESFYSAELETVEAPEKKSRSKKGLPAFSSLENFFDGQKVPVKKSRRK
jgi:hypothetical protein